MDWRLGLDLGPASLGWTALRLDTASEPIGLMDGSVRLFSDGRESDGESANVRRRTQRGIRRNKDRQRSRQKAVETWLVKHGLLSSHDHDIRALNPYEARAGAATQAVAPEVLARACLALAKARGFKSNRKSDNPDEETSAFKEKLSGLKDQLAGRTLGQWLFDQQQEQHRLFLETKNTPDAKPYVRQGLRFRGESEFFPERAMLEAEFDRIREVQAPHQTLDADAWAGLRDRIFKQRPLKPQERGQCTLFIKEVRAHAALPTAQAFRIEQTLANLRVQNTDHSSAFLSPEQRDVLRDKLNQQKNLSFTAMLKLKSGKDLLFPQAQRFNLDTIANNRLTGNETAISLMKVMGQGAWDALGLRRQDELVEQLITSQDNDSLLASLKADTTLAEHAPELLKLRFSSGTMNLSLKAMGLLTPLMAAGMNYADAVVELRDEDGKPLHHSRLIPQRILPGQPLPYYGAVLRASVIGGDEAKFDAHEEPEQHFGRIANPSVHVALNQVRQVINALIKRYGHPQVIHIELARDIAASAGKRKDIAKEQARNRKDKDRLRLIAQTLGVEHPSRTDLLKLKLWEQLNTKDESDRRCVYTGRRIAGTDVLTARIEIEHILPFSRTLDDRISNKVLAFKDANALKGDKTPFEAFASNAQADKGMDWDGIQSRAATLHEATGWRFGPDAMERFTEREGDFVARALNDTGYLARLTRQYLETLTGPENVVVVSGRNTANLRHDWGLNRLLNADGSNAKNRGDHRHHLIDAFVIALTTRSVLQRMARDAKYSDLDHRHKRGVFPLHDSQRQQLVDLLDKCTPSIKPDHSAQGQFYKETAYGLNEALPGMAEDRQFSTRKSVVGMRSEPLKFITEGEVEGICDPAIRRALHAFMNDHAETGAKPKELCKLFIQGPLCDLVEKRGIKRLKIMIKNQAVKPIASAPYKGYAIAEYAFADIWHLPANAQQKTPKTMALFVDRPTGMKVLNEGHRPPRPDHPGARRLMRLFKDDVVSVTNKQGERELFRVCGFSATNNRLDVRPLTMGGGKQTFVSVNQLATKGLSKVNIRPDGTIRGSN